MVTWLKAPIAIEKLNTYQTRARDIIGSVWGYMPVTILGISVAILAWAALLLFGRERQDVVFWVAGHVLLFAVAFSALFVLLGFVLLKFYLARSSTGIGPRAGSVTGSASAARRVFETDNWVETGFTQSALRWLPWVRVRWRWVSPITELEIRTRRGVQSEYVCFRERGFYHQVIREFRVEDVLGLSMIVFRHKQTGSETSFEVWPQKGVLQRNLTFVAHASGDDTFHPLGEVRGDRAELRRYVAGDPARFIHWKNFARSRKLVTRVPERAVAPLRSAAVYFVAGIADDATAKVTRAMLELGAFGDEWVFGADGTDSLTSATAPALESLVRSAQFFRESGGKGLGRFLSRVRMQGPFSLILFVPAVSGPWISRVRAALGAARADRIVTGVPSADEVDPGAWWKQWALLPSENVFSSTALAALRNDLQALSATSGAVHLIDAQTGNIVKLQPTPTAHRWTRTEKKQFASG